MEFSERTAIEPHFDNDSDLSPYYLLDLTKAYIDYLPSQTILSVQWYIGTRIDSNQAQTISSNEFWIEADVELNNPKATGKKIYNLSKQYNLNLMGNY